MRYALVTIALVGSAMAAPVMAQLTQTGIGSAFLKTSPTIASDGHTKHGTVVIDFNGIGGNSNSVVAGVSSQLVLNYLGVDSLGMFDFSYTISNTSTTQSRVSGFAFDTNPTVSSGTTGAGSIFNDVQTTGKYPNGIGTVTACLINNNGNSCSGGGSGGVSNGDAPGTGTFALSFTGSTASGITFTNFYDRYQNLPNPYGSGVGYPVPAVPESATWAMMLLGFAGIGMAMRPKRARMQSPMQTA